MKIHFCDLCNESVPQSDLDEGRARMVKGRVVCASCERAMSLAAASAGAPPAEAPADPSTAPAPVAALPPVPASAPAGGRSTAVWMAAASLGLSAVLVYVFQQRVDELHSADTGLARGIEQSSSQLRKLDAELGRLPAQTAEIEQRLTQKLELALASSEKQRGELAAATQRADESLAELQRAITDLRRELESGARTREERLDELSHRLAAGEDAQRELNGRLGEYQKSAESARAAAEAAAKALPEKPAAPAGPAWNSLLPNLADANPSTRWEAVDELGRSKDAAVIPHLLPLLKDSDLFVRMCVARVLADLGTLQGVPALIDALEDAEPTVRESAWNALRTLTGKDFKFDPQGNEGDRQKKVKTWREWWKKEGEGLLNGGTPPDGKQPAEIRSGTQKS
jgi:HEAT repeats